METIILPTAAFILIAAIAFKQSRGFMSLPTIFFLYFVCIYIGGLRLWFQVYSDTYLYVLLAAGAFVLGGAVVRKLRVSHSTRAVIAKQMEFDIGVHPKILLYSLGTLTLLSLAIWAYWLWIVGVPLTAGGTPSVNWVESSAGVSHRLLASFGGENLAFEGLGWYALYKVRGKRFLLLLASGCVMASAMFSAFQGSKGSAVMTLLWFAIALFYLNRRTPKLKTFLLMGAFVVPVTWWVTSFYVYLPRQTVFSIIYNRMTTIEVGGLNYLIQVWVPRFGIVHGHTFAMDIARIKAQFLGGIRPVVFHEYIWNILNNANPYTSNRLSEDLTLFGVGYANYGAVGGIFFTILLGVACEIHDAYLMTSKRIHFVLFAVAMYWNLTLLTMMLSGDVVILGFEAFFITVLPKLLAFLAVYAAFCLPFRIPLRWSKPSPKRRKGLGPGEAPPASKTGHPAQPYRPQGGARRRVPFRGGSQPWSR
jgi:hypothetical protein